MLAKYAVAIASSLALVSAGANGPVSFPSWGFPTTSSKCTSATVTATSTTTATKTVTPAPVTATVTASATCTSAPAVAATGVAACTDVIIGDDISGGVYDYSLIYNGANTLNPNNAGVQAGTPSYNYTFPGSYSACQAAYAAGNASYNQLFEGTDSTGGYTFNVYFRDATQDWYAVAYYNAALASDFNVATAGVSQSYGYVKSN